MRTGLVALWMLLYSITSAATQVSVGIELPGLSIGFNQPAYPQLVPVPGYPVYYAPQVNSNYFFYDGMYWLYQRDNWYASSWYNGPWQLVAPEVVPLYVLRVPVRYYRRPPAYFHGWRSDAPPHWGEYWGNAWEQHRSGWDNWDRSSAPSPAPLPVYQRQYSGNRYPRVEQQQVLQSQHYRYQPHDAVVPMQAPVRQTQSVPAQAPRVQSVPAVPAPPPHARQAVPQERGSPQQDQRGPSRQSSVQQGEQPQKGGGERRGPAIAQAPPQQVGQPAQHQRQQPEQAAAQHEQQAPRSQDQDKGPQGKGPAHEPKRSQEKGREQGEQRDGEHNK
jgi:hypothetical protein